MNLFLKALPSLAHWDVLSLESLDLDLDKYGFNLIVIVAFKNKIIRDEFHVRGTFCCKKSLFQDSMWNKR